MVQYQDSYEKRFRELERRLATLERSPRLTRSSVSDANGVTRVELGELTGGAFGLAIYAENGLPIYRFTDDGQDRPTQQIPVGMATIKNSTTSASYAEMMIWDYVATARYFQLVYFVDPGASTTCDVRITAYEESGGGDFPDVAYPTETTIYQETGISSANFFDTGHVSLPGGADSPGRVWRVALQMRRTSGTGTPEVRQSLPAAQRVSA